MLNRNAKRFQRRGAAFSPRLKIFSTLTLIALMLFSAACAPALQTLLQAKLTPQATVAAPTAGGVPATGKQSANAGSRSTQATTVPATPTAAGGMPGMANEGQLSAVKVSDQPVSNGAVKVDLVTSQGPGWVVIYSVNAAGQPNQAIGHAPVKAGLNPNVVVPIDASKATGTLYAQLHVDAGTVGTFEFPGPDVPVMNGVQMISSTFKVTQAAAEANSQAGTNAQPTATTSAEANMNSMPGMNATQPANANANPPAGQANGQMVPNIIVANQPIIDGKVVIPEVDSASPAWLVVHKQNGDGTLGAMSGFAHVSEGVNKNVVVPLDLNSTSTVMYAMLHQDLGVPNKLEYPGPDEPVFVNGQMIAPTFEVTTSSAADVVVALGSLPETAHFLVDGHDMSLYISLRDTPGKSTCTGDCLNTWKPLIASGRIVTGSGLQANKLGVILRPDGTRQVTYLNAPLYTYAKDSKPGDVNGQGFDGTWYLVTP